LNLSAAAKLILTEDSVNKPNDFTQVFPLGTPVFFGKIRVAFSGEVWYPCGSNCMAEATLHNKTADMDCPFKRRKIS
jgi:hypothetical protein